MFLSEETSLRLENGRGKTEPVAWRTVSIGVIPRLALVLPANSSIVFETRQVSPGDVGLITFGPAAKGSVPGALRLTVRFRPADANASEATEAELFSEELPDFNAQEPWIEARFQLDEVAGKSGSLVVECASTGDSGSQKGELGLYEFVVSDEGMLDLNRARAFKQLRMRTEKANFDAYYQHLIFQRDDEEDSPPAPAVPTQPPQVPRAPFSVRRPLRKLLKKARAMVAQSAAVKSSIKREGEEQSSPPGAVAAASKSAFSYSHSLLSQKLELNPPSFGWRLRAKVEEIRSAPTTNGRSKVRVLSVCSGAARIENDLIRGLPGESLDLTLLDLNPDLLNTARKRLSRWCDVQCITGDVNELDLQGERFDVILCVSGLHHVVEMEHVMETAARGLNDGGEFWSIGENIGRNGGRLWPECYEVANGFFSKLESRYRVNRMTGLTVDESLPDLDYSIGCFEGIRCEAIEPNLLKYFTPIDVCRHNCTIWKLFSATYSDNYDMSRPEDAALIHHAVDLDVDLFRRGGRPIELNGIYGVL